MNESVKFVIDNKNSLNDFHSLVSERTDDLINARRDFGDSYVAVGWGFFDDRIKVIYKDSDHEMGLWLMTYKELSMTNSEWKEYIESIEKEKEAKKLKRIREEKIQDYKRLKAQFYKAEQEYEDLMKGEH